MRDALRSIRFAPWSLEVIQRAAKLNEKSLGAYVRGAAVARALEVLGLRAQYEKEAQGQQKEEIPPPFRSRQTRQ